MNVLRKFVKSVISEKGQPPVYIGDMAVVPRKDYKRLLEFGWESKDTDQQIKEWVSELLEMPMASDSESLPENSVTLDVLITDYQCGSDAFMWSQPFLPILWRPCVKLFGRLVRRSDGKVMGTFSTKKAMRWKTYFWHVLTLRNYFSFKGVFTEEDMKTLLGGALIELLQWAKKKI